MPRDILNPFTDVEDRPIEPGEYWGSDVLGNIKSLHYGSGGKSYNVSDEGMWLGADTFASAPFRVDMAGNAVAISMTVGGYVVTGGAAADVNSGAVQITGVKIQDGTITAEKINVTSLSALSANLGTMTAGSISGVDITIGTGNNVFKANSQGIFLGNANVALAPFYVNMAGTLKATNAIIDGSIICRGGSDWQGNSIDGNLYVRNINANYITAGIINAAVIGVVNLNASNINAGTLNAAAINVTNLNASNIVSGNYSVGQSGKPGNITIARTSASGAGSNARLLFEGGSRIWADTNNQIGINSLGSPMYIYVDSSERIIIPSSGQTTIRGGAFLDGNVNVNNGSLRLNSGDIIWYDSKLEGGHNRYVFKDTGGSEQVSIEPNGGGNSRLNMNGYNLRLTSNKTAIIPTREGYRALYCMESPEVWFMDFCSATLISPIWQFWNKQYKYHVDPMFKETASQPFIYMPTTDPNVFQVWGRRRGHQLRRFEKKSKKEFLANEKFYRMAKPN